MSSRNSSTAALSRTLGKESRSREKNTSTWGSKTARKRQTLGENVLWGKSTGELIILCYASANDITSFGLRKQVNCVSVLVTQNLQCVGIPWYFPDVTKIKVGKLLLELHETRVHLAGGRNVVVQSHSKGWIESLNRFRIEPSKNEAY